jgi:uncharacterized membrane protein
MTLEPLLSAPLAVQIHVATVLPAAVLGAFLLLWRARGSAIHRLIGKVWLVLMVVTAISSFFIHALNVWHGFSPIHLLSAMTISGCIYAYRMARRGNIRAHRLAVIQIYVGGILIAGGFTLMPHRIMNKVVFSQTSPSGLALLALAICLPWLLFYLWQNRLMPSVDDRNP